MRREEIEIAVLPDGRIEYTIKGIKGHACEDISELLEQLGRVETTEHTTEYYEQEGNVGIHLSQS